jgi:hypothetical protein
MTDSNQNMTSAVLTVEDTLSIAKLMLKTNETISTLEVKLVARGLGFYAEQKAVSEFLNSIYRAKDELKLARRLDSTGTHYEYLLEDSQSTEPTDTFAVILGAIDNLKNMAVELITDATTVKDLSNVDETIEITLTNTDPIVEEDINPTKITLPKTKYIQPTQATYDKNRAKKVQAVPAEELQHRTDVDVSKYERPELWMVAFDTAEALGAEVYYIGDGVMNMDRVRSMYARRRKLPVSDVRARAITKAHMPYSKR